jgi:hypothetical protein
MVARQVVNAVPAKPPKYGIFATLGGSTALTDGDWEQGWKFLPEGCGVSGAMDIECAGTTPEQPALAQTSEVTGDPFVVYAEDRCSTFGWKARDWSGRAKRQLAATRSYQIAKEVWAGAIATVAGLDNIPLTDPTSTTVGTGPMAVRHALACVEGALGECCQGCVGIVHMTPQLLSELAAFPNAVMLQGAQWVTANGHVVIPDAGYDGSGPGGTPAGDTQWMYGTSMMGLRVDDIVTIPEDDSAMEVQMDRATNDMLVTAYQVVGVQWDHCCHIAAEVDVPVCVLGGNS